MIVLLCLAFFVSGALWRRWLGGWMGGRRWWRFAALPVLLWPLFLALPWWVALTTSAGLACFFADDHKVDGWGAVRRYGPFGLGYPLAFRFWRPAWNRPPVIDGWMAVGELFLGGTVWACVPLVLMIP